jgi:uncharacterized protein YjbJ (UPF0337 family)
MSWEQIQGKWHEYKGQAKQRWGKLTDNDLTVIDGQREVLAGKLLVSYRKSKESVEKEITEFEAACKAYNTTKLARGTVGSV